MSRLEALPKFTLSMRVYFEDTDCGGVVYHANYLKFMERARSEWFLSLGHHRRTFVDHGVHLIVHSAELKFIKPAYLYDQLLVETFLIKKGRASLHYKHIIRSAEAYNTIYCEGSVLVACVNQLLQPCPIPEDLIKGLK